MKQQKFEIRWNPCVSTFYLVSNCKLGIVEFSSDFFVFRLCNFEDFENFKQHVLRCECAPCVSDDVWLDDGVDGTKKMEKIGFNCQVIGKMPWSASKKYQKKIREMLVKTIKKSFKNEKKISLAGWEKWLKFKFEMWNVNTQSKSHNHNTHIELRVKNLNPKLYMESEKSESNSRLNVFRSFVSRRPCHVRFSPQIHACTIHSEHDTGLALSISDFVLVLPQIHSCRFRSTLY